MQLIYGKNDEVGIILFGTEGIYSLYEQFYVTDISSSILKAFTLFNSLLVMCSAFPPLHLN